MQAGTMNSLRIATLASQIRDLSRGLVDMERSESERVRILLLQLGEARKEVRRLRRTVAGLKGAATRLKRSNQCKQSSE